MIPKDEKMEDGRYAKTQQKRKTEQQNQEEKILCTVYHCKTGVAINFCIDSTPNYLVSVLFITFYFLLFTLDKTHKSDEREKRSGVLVTLKQLFSLPLTATLRQVLATL